MNSGYMLNCQMVSFCLQTQLETRFKEFEGIANMQNVDFPAKVLRGILEVGYWSLFNMFIVVHRSFFTINHY